ncbi:class I SAM-dependent methyltransferase [Roseobacter sinensis]|uniref:Class I SAM-dependent methyltransferase n=1 Tax=Roseobacter sinensis TaxID=2931391 RepID=A0ABT3BJP9_9RHOB|nr:class I SAM-dependent methyltransferase [Roseobacter sp. WL0113]MCV3273792.1 class I SAM-dependent methyltransferase [Roseobacter sp. WL0113]
MTPNEKRISVIKTLLPAQSATLLDVGCGRVAPDYPYLDHAEQITCVDWNPRIIAPTPDKIDVRAGDFLEMDFAPESFDTILCADVFEHVALEQEAGFVAGCIRYLKPGGTMVVSVPHAGTYAWLDPFEVKPLVNRIQHRLGMHPALHNGFCDIRKGHKHYSTADCVQAFAPLEPVEMRQWGYFYDPLYSWSDALRRKLGLSLGHARIARACAAEYDRAYGDRAFNLAIAFRKPG